MSSKIEPLNIEENTSKPNERRINNGYFVSKKLVIILAVVVSLVYAGSIIATYFGKEDGGVENYDCQELLCSNFTLLTSNFENKYYLYM